MSFNLEGRASVGGFLGTVVWGVAAGIGLRLGWGIVGWILSVLSKAVES